jgi:HD-GYP domain-containing protein (c-di-GMP phosphodiesterase class II)
MSSSFDTSQVITVDYLRDGMVLSGPLYDMKGSFLWPARVPIRQEFIDRLKSLGITELTYRPISIETAASKSQVSDPMISEETQRKVYNSFANVVWDITNNSIPRLDKAKESINDVAKEIRIGIGKTINLLDLKSHDEYSYVHAVNCSLLATLVATKFGFTSDRVSSVGVGSLLMDIGKIKIPSSVLNKKEPLTPIEIDSIRKHPVIGYQLIKDSTEIDDIAKRIVLMHHERVDGRGYPLGVTGDKIDVYVKISSICDAFDAMTTERPYRPPLPIRVAIEEILKEAGTKFDPEVALRFAVEVSKVYKIQSPLSENSVVQLSTGEIGVVLRLHSDYDMMPEVLIVLDTFGNPLRNIVSVDLIKDSVGRKVSKIIYDTSLILKVKSLAESKIR